MLKIISKLQADIDFKLNLHYTENTINHIKIQKGSRNNSVLITPLIDNTLQRVYGLGVALGLWYFLCKKQEIVHSYSKAKILNIPYCENYSHCFLDVIPKLLYEDNTCEYDIIYACGSEILNSLIDLLQLKFKKVNFLNKKPVQLVDADKICVENHEVYHIRDKQKTKLLKAQIDLIINNTYKSEISNRLIYCSRSGSNVEHGRKMDDQNERDIISILKDYCIRKNLLFTFFNGEENSVTMSHLNQLKLFSEAKIVIGPHGGAMANIIYLNPNKNCSICEFTSGNEVIVQRGPFVNHYNFLYGFLPEELYNYYLIPFHKDSTSESTKIDLDNLWEFLNEIDK